MCDCTSHKIPKVLAVVAGFQQERTLILCFAKDRLLRDNAIMFTMQSWVVYSVTALIFVVIVDYAKMLYRRQKMVILPQLSRLQDRIADTTGYSRLDRDHGLSLETPSSCLKRSHGI